MSQKIKRQKLPCWGTPCLMCRTTERVVRGIERRVKRRIGIERRNDSQKRAFIQEKEVS